MTEERIARSILMSAVLVLGVAGWGHMIQQDSPTKALDSWVYLAESCEA